MYLPVCINYLPYEPLAIKSYCSEESICVPQAEGSSENDTVGHDLYLGRDNVSLLLDWE